MVLGPQGKGDLGSEPQLKNCTCLLMIHQKAASVSDFASYRITSATCCYFRATFCCSVGRRREFQLASEMHGKVLDVRGANKDPGANVIVYSKHSPAAKNQLWYTDHQGFLRSALNDFALDASTCYKSSRLLHFVRITIQKRCRKSCGFHSCYRGHTVVLITLYFLALTSDCLSAFNASKFTE